LNQQENFVYFGQKTDAIYTYTDGDFYLISDSNKRLYHILPWHKSNSLGLYYFGVCGDPGTITAVSNIIQAAFPQQYTIFSVKACYIITWVLTSSSGKSTVFQVILATDETNSYMIVLYQKLGLAADEASYYTDAKGTTFFFETSTTDSNCGVPGQFIFSFNNQTS
jgi:hypothetical protein